VDLAGQQSDDRRRRKQHMARVRPEARRSSPTTKAAVMGDARAWIDKRASVLSARDAPPLGTTTSSRPGRAAGSCFGPAMRQRAVTVLVLSNLATVLSRRGETPARAGNAKVRDGVTFGDADCCTRSNAGASIGPSETCEMDEDRRCRCGPSHSCLVPRTRKSADRRPGVPTKTAESTWGGSSLATIGETVGSRPLGKRPTP
jgi:hypothetical protein